MNPKPESILTFSGDSKPAGPGPKKARVAKSKPFRAKSLRITTHNKLGAKVNVEHLNKATVLKDVKKVIDADQIKAAKKSGKNLFVLSHKLEAHKALMLAKTVEYNGFSYYVIPPDRYLAYEDDKVILGASTNAHGTPIMLPISKCSMYTDAAYQEFKLTEEMINESW